MPFRRALFWIHLIAGSVAGIVILIMSVTGVLLAYQRQMIRWSDSNYRSGVLPAGAGRLPVDSLLAGFNGADKPSGVTLRAEPSAPVEVSFGRERVVLVDAYSGRILGESSPRLRAFLARTEELHRWLAAAGAHRAAGRGVTGACNLAFLVLVLSGPFLWLPRKWSRQNVAAVAFFRRKLSGRARDFNWHNVIGIWTAAPLLVIVVSGVVMSYSWANNLIYSLTGTVAPTQNAAPRSGGAHRAESSSGGVTLDPLFVQAEAKLPDWRVITLRLTPSGRGPLTFTIDTADSGRPNTRSQLILNPRTGEEMRLEPFSSYNQGRRIRVWLRFLHTGEAFGWIGQTVAACASAGAAVLVWTGLALAVRRLGRWRSRRHLLRSDAVTVQS